MLTTAMMDLDTRHMQHALKLAAQGQGMVEPNPMVGCIITQEGIVVGEGWHRRFGEAHAEIEALRVAGSRAAGATMYVTLEPCCHQGKTPPCTRAIIAAGLARVVVAQADPFPEVAGAGLAELAAAGLQVEVGLMEADARRLNAPYIKLVETGRPWIIAKWAMTLCGKTATRTGSSRWISGEASRGIVHSLRGRMDAIVVGADTARCDNPMLTARPPGPRTAIRVVLDTRAALSSESQLVTTARSTPTLVAVGREAPEADRRRLTDAGCEVFVCPGEEPAARLDALLVELGRRRLTNVLVEGGGQLVGSLLDAGQIDEVHAFVAPKLVGGVGAPSPAAGAGVFAMDDAMVLDNPVVRQVGDDVYVSGHVRRASE